MSSGTCLADVWPCFRRLSKSDKEILLAWPLQLSCRGTRREFGCDDSPDTLATAQAP